MKAAFARTRLGSIDAAACASGATVAEMEAVPSDPTTASLMADRAAQP